ncbi:MAG: MAPEG family protein [Asticcacaulis sp.]
MLQPVLVLIAWSILMLVWLYVRRLPMIFAYALSKPQLVDGEATRLLPPPVQWPADAYNNLLEQPTLFYALALGIYLSGRSSFDLEYLAWLYVALRITHSLIQATVNIVVIRFCLFVISSGVLGLMCWTAMKLIFNL